MPCEPAGATRLDQKSAVAGRCPARAARYVQPAVPELHGLPLEGSRIVCQPGVVPMRLALALIAAVPLLAQDPAAPTPVPSTEPVVTGSIDLGYRFTSVGGDNDVYRSVVNLGQGPRLIGLDFTVVDPQKRLFDRLDVRANNWGGDPYNTVHVSAAKQG